MVVVECAVSVVAAMRKWVFSRKWTFKPIEREGERKRREKERRNESCCLWWWRLRWRVKEGIELPSGDVTWVVNTEYWKLQLREAGLARDAIGSGAAAALFQVRCWRKLPSFKDVWQLVSQQIANSRHWRLMLGCNGIVRPFTKLTVDVTAKSGNQAGRREPKMRTPWWCCCCGAN